ncbi:hypothetical protein ALC57_10804 [Trachymyrmex cornetzi]|uniref:Uncharacterized protein n=1 Tax=Trachymyrmex cornetzi TaxID=471704 RepID=A0A151J397_9HYME|nr:hypothetical protein ALC57_10804 [Trachymyrmex cornetzi]
MASKKKHVEKLPMASLTEPVRKSVLDVIQYNLRAIGYRMENIIRDLRVDYNNMPITGLFLVYPSCYIHILEAWEDIIYKHYELMYAMDDDKCKFEKAIPLPSYHHVHQVGDLICRWCHVYMIPLTLIGTLEAHTLDDILKQVSNCLIKVYTLCEYIAKARSKGDIKRPTLCADVEQRFDEASKNSIDVQDVLLNLGDKAYLPESTVLEFLLNVNSPVLKTVEEHLQIYSDASPSAFWDDNNVWPPPCDIMPRDAFDGRKVPDHRSVLDAFQEIATRCWVNVIVLYSTVMKAPDCQPLANAEHLLFSGCAPIQTEWKKESHRISTGTTVDHRGSFHRKCKHALGITLHKQGEMVFAFICGIDNTSAAWTEARLESYPVAMKDSRLDDGICHGRDQQVASGYFFFTALAQKFQIVKILPVTCISVNYDIAVILYSASSPKPFVSHSIDTPLNPQFLDRRYREIDRSRHSIHRSTSRIIASENVSDNASFSYSTVNPTNYSIIRQHTDDASCTLHTAKAACVQALLYSKYDRKSATCLSFPAFPAYLAQPQLMIMHCTSLNL